MAMLAGMEWRRRPGLDPSDPNGVADLLARACDLDVGEPIDGTRFLFRTTDMVAASREIERAAFLQTDVPLYVGVQRGERLEAQRDVYEPMVRAGVPIYAFGTDDAPDIDGISWTVVDDDGHTLASQWFVVRDGDDPRALVGFELTTPGEQRRTWEGFHSRDPRLVSRLAEHLSALVDHRVDA